MNNNEQPIRHGIVSLDEVAGVEGGVLRWRSRAYADMPARCTTCDVLFSEDVPRWHSFGALTYTVILQGAPRTHTQKAMAICQTCYDTFRNIRI